MRKLSTEDFIERSKTLYPDKYVYIETKYITSEVKVKLICKIHNQSFYQLPSNHLFGKTGCPSCKIKPIILRISTDDFIRKAQLIHHDRYENLLKSAGYSIISIWESDWYSIKRKVKQNGILCK